MRSGSGVFLAAAAALAIFTPSATVAADPAIVYQAQPIARILEDARATAKLIAGDKADKAFNFGIKLKLGDKGFLGLDLNRPVLGYIDVTPDLTDTVLVLALPVTNEKDFLEFCERWNKSKPKSLRDGLYEVPALNAQLKAVMRVIDGYAYIATGVKDPARVLDAKSIVPTAKLYDPTDSSLASGRVYFDRLPKEVRAKAKAELDSVKKQLDEAIGGQPGVSIMVFAEPVLKLTERMLDLSEGAKGATLRLDLKPGTADFAATLTVTPIAGSPLEKVVTEMNSTMNGFAGLVTPDAAAGLRLRMPFDVPEIRDSTVKGLEALQKVAPNLAFPPMIPVIDEFLKGAIRSVKAGPVDVAAVVRGPDQDGFFTHITAITFDDPSGVEKALKKLITGTAPQEIQKAIKWDAEKNNGVSIHTFDLALVPEREGGAEFRRIYGPNGKMAFAFAPKAFYSTMGPDAIGAIKAAMALKPAEAPQLDVVINPSRLVKLVQSADPQSGAMVAKAVGTDDKLSTMVGLSISGGKELTAKFGFNGILVGKWFMLSEVSEGGGNAHPVPPPPVLK